MSHLPPKMFSVSLLFCKRSSLVNKWSNLPWCAFFPSFDVLNVKNDDNTKKNSKTKRVDFGKFEGAEHEYKIYFFLARQVFSAFCILI